MRLRFFIFLPILHQLDLKGDGLIIAVSGVKAETFFILGESKVYIATKDADGFDDTGEAGGVGSGLLGQGLDEVIAALTLL